MKQILIPPSSSRGEIISHIYNLEIQEKAYFNMHQDGGACIMRTSPDCYILCSIPLYGGEEGFEMAGGIEAVKRMVEEALSWT